MKLSSTIVNLILASSDLQLKLAQELKRHQASIKRLTLQNENNSLLTTVSATNVLINETGYTIDEILVDEKVNA